MEDSTYSTQQLQNVFFFFRNAKDKFNLAGIETQHILNAADIVNKILT